MLCDDDLSITQKVYKLISQRSKYKELELQIDIRHSGDFIYNEKAYYDIAFVDIEMKGISGLKLSELLKERNSDVIIIIITSFSDYLDNAMKIRVFRYLSKPLNENRLYNSLYDAIKLYYSTCKTIIIDLKDEVYTIKTKDILYLEKRKYGSKIVTKKKEFITNKKVDEWLKIIDQPNCFAFSHNSFAVNLQNVIDFNTSKVTLRKNESEVVEAYMSQRKFVSFKKAFFSLVGGKNDSFL